MLETLAVIAALGFPAAGILFVVWVILKLGQFGKFWNFPMLTRRIIALSLMLLFISIVSFILVSALA